MAKKQKKATRKTTKSRRRKGWQARFIPWAKRFGLYIGAFVLILWLGAWIVFSGAAGSAWRWSEAQALELSADMGLRIDNILLEGREHASRDILLALINVRKGDPLFSLNPEEARDLIRRVDWVRDARIERRWPDTIYIDIQERRPLALWQRSEKLHLIDTAGEIIMTGRMERFKTLKIVIGEDAPQKAGALIETLKAHEPLYTRMRAAQRIDTRRWNLVLKNGTIVKLPENDVSKAIQRVVDMHDAQDLLDRPLESIDARAPDRLIVRTRPGELQNLKLPAAGQDDNDQKAL